MKKNKRIRSRFLAAALSLTLATGLFAGVGGKSVDARTASVDAETARIAYEKIMGAENNPPAEFLKETDPFGYGKGQDFMLITMNELFALTTETGDKKSVKSYSKLKSANEDLSPLTLGEAVNDPDPYKAERAGYVEDYTNNYTNDMSFCQMVSFDPDKSLRNDHIAIVGVKSDKKIYVKIIDKQARLVKEICLGNASWMDQSATDHNDRIYDFNAMNFLSLTAGDYNGDGYDSVVVYACLDNNSYGLFEIYDKEYDPVTDKVVSNGFNLKSTTASKNLLNAEYIGIYKTHLEGGGSNLYVGNKLHCDVDTGDINGDGIDDLVVLSYVNRTTEGIIDSDEKMRDKQVDMYRPLLAARYGVKDFTGNITDDYSRRIGVWKKISKDNEDPEYVSMMAGGLSVGDVDADGDDDVVLAGFKNIIEGNPGDTNKDVYNLYKNKLVIAVYCDSKDTNKEVWPSPVFDYEQTNNNWTAGEETKGGLFVGTDQGTLKTDNSWQRTSVETVAINGKGTAKLIFINGYMYEYSAQGQTVSCVCQTPYFQHTDTGFGSITAEETYIRSTAVGVFDGNKEGKEQIIYVIGAADQNVPGDAIYTIGMISGKFVDKNNKPLTKAVEFYSTTEDRIASNYYPDNNGATCSYKSCMNYAICAWDNNSDGMHAKFTDKGYVYSDPEVMAVLQAPPYFEEMDGTTSGAETEYALTTSYSYDTSEGNSVSWGVSFEMEAESDAVKFALSAGVENDWSETFSAGLTTTDEYTFKAIGEDQVVIYRTPFVIYRYQVETNGEWSDDNITEFTFPGVPAREIISVDSYNAFVEYYNMKNEELAAEANKSLPDDKKIADDKIPKLDKIVDEWLGNAGDPFGYMQSTSGAEKTVLQNTPSAFEMGSSATGYSWSKENSSSKETTHSHGFNFDVQLLFGGGALGSHVHMGLSTSLSYTHDYSTCETNADGVGTSCEIGNIDSALLQAAGISPATAREYGFKYQMVSWPSGLKKVIKVPDDPLHPEGDTHDETVDIPIYGYMLSGTRAPAKPVDDLEAELVTAEGSDPVINLKWTKPERDSDPAVGYALYKYENDGSVEKIADIDIDATTYTFKDLDWRSEYAFVLRTKGAFTGTESVNSNIAKVFSDSSGIFAIELLEEGPDKDTYIMKHMNGKTTVFSVAHKTPAPVVKAPEIVSVEKTGENGNVSSYSIAFSDGTSQKFDLKDNTINELGVKEEGTTFNVAVTKSKLAVKEAKPGETPTVEYKGTNDTSVKEVVIPDTVNSGGVSYKVTEVSPKALSGYKKLKSVTLGSNITEIGANAFANCPELTTIIINSKVTKIGANAFANCKKLKTIIVNTKKLTNKSLAKTAFKGLKTSVVIKVPKAKKKAYTTLFRKKGLSKKNKIKNI